MAQAMHNATLLGKQQSKGKQQWIENPSQSHGKRNSNILAAKKINSISGIAQTLFKFVCKKYFQITLKFP